MATRYLRGLCVAVFGEIKAQNLVGVKDIYTVTEEKFEADPI